MSAPTILGRLLRDIARRLDRKWAIPMLFPPGHFYSPIVDPYDIRSREREIWSPLKTMIGVDLNEGGQIALLHQLSAFVQTIDYPIDQPADPRTYYYRNDQFPVLDAEVLHTILCCFAPKRMIEVGSGFSSLVTANVNRRILGGAIDFTCIEPYPRQFLVDGVQGISRVLVERVELVGLDLFDTLSDGDILFIDSSHVAKTGSDVNYLFFQVIPRLKPGVIVHLHDIFLPDEYPRKWVIEDGRHWNEQYILRAFLAFNGSFEVLWASHFMGRYHLDAVRSVFRRYPELGGGGSFWMRRTH